MKTRIKVLVLVLTLPVGLPVLAWSVAFLYWHVRITREIRVLDSLTLGPGSPEEGRAHWELREAGCRATPYLVDSLEPSRGPRLLHNASILIAIQVESPGRIDFYQSDPIAKRFDQWKMPRSADKTETARVCREIRSFWTENGHTYHQWWRIWSSDCRAPR